MRDDFEHVDAPSSAESGPAAVGPVMPSRYARVLFRDVPDAYSAGTDVTCRYAITPSLTPAARDWVGVFRIGWRTPADYVQYTWAPPPGEGLEGRAGDLLGEVLLTGGRLPTDDGEFYQFCYVTAGGEVGGASTPFQFIRRSAGGGAAFVAVDDDDDVGLVVVTTRVTALETDLRRAAAREDEFTHDKALLEAECSRLLDELADYDSRLTAAVAERDALRTTLEECREQLSAAQSAVESESSVEAELQRTVDDLTEEAREVGRQLAEKEGEVGALRAQLKGLVSDNDRLSGETRALKQQKSLVETHACTADDKMAAYQRETAELRREVSAQSQLCAAHRKHALQLGAAAQRDAAAVQQSHRDVESLAEQLRNAEDKLTAAAHCKQLYSSEVTAVQEAHRHLAGQLETEKNAVCSLEQQLGVAEARHEVAEARRAERAQEQVALSAALGDCRQQLAACQKEMALLGERVAEAEAARPPPVSEAALHALRDAHAALREQLAVAKRQRGGYERQLEQLVCAKVTWEEREAELGREVADLQERLLMGEEHYKTQFVDCLQVKRELRRLRKQVTQTDPEHGGRATTTQTESKGQGQATTTQTEAKGQGQANTTQTEPKGQGQANTTQTEPKGHGQANTTQTEPKGQGQANTTQTEPKGQGQANTTQTEPKGQGQASTTQTEPKQDAQANSTDVESNVASLRAALARASQSSLRYRELYVAERKRAEFRQRHYLEELRRRDAPPDAGGATSQQQQILALKSIIDEQKTQIEQLSAVFQRSESVMRRGVVYPPTADSGAICLQPTAAGAGFLRPPADPEAAADLEAADLDDLDPLTSRSACLGAPLLTPLPAPIQPVVLPSAKAAAVLAICNGLSVTEVTTESDTGETQVKTADGGDTCVTAGVGGVTAEGAACPVCGASLGAGLSEVDVWRHVETHYGPECPVCQRCFPPAHPADRFLEHVQLHFDEDIE